MVVHSSGLHFGQVANGGLLNFYRKVKITAGCWEWQGHLDRGYGRFMFKGIHYPAHRFSYLIAVGDLDPNKHIDHLCRNPSCVRPDHLEQVTPRENQFRGFGPASINLRKDRCIKGHALSGDNVYVPPRGGRHCRACQRRRGIEAYHRKRAVRGIK